ncbi:MAG TPA: class I SAM-dependent methyltransferase [Longimicrobium sp.]|nr:class I SAM-dependent methyltransferase [Longimicrobium sp.]
MSARPKPPKRTAAKPAAAKPPAAAPGDARRADAGYYQALHDTSPRYQTNNWLIDDLPALLAVGAESILEVGCGNGLFLQRAAKHWKDVTGVDWARSPVLDRVLRENPGIRFVQQDVAAFRPERRYGLLASADFLEHLPPASLPEVIRRLHAAADVCYHRIACYDDGHSHLSVFRPKSWLRRFEAACPGAGYRIVGTSVRKGRRKKTVVVISNLGASR